MITLIKVGLLLGILLITLTRIFKRLDENDDAFFEQNKQYPSYSPRDVFRIVRRPLIAGLIALAAAGILDASWVQVGPAQTMALFDPFGGGIQNKDYGEGWHLVKPWAQKKYFSTLLQEYTMSAKHDEGSIKGDDSMVCQTNDGLSVRLDATTIFRIPKNGAHTLWRSVGPNFVDVIIRPTARNVVRMNVSKYAIMELYSNAPTDYQGKVGVDFYVGKRRAIEQGVTTDLAKTFKDKGLELDMFLLRNVAYEGDTFHKAIVAKQVAQQSVTTQFYRSQAAAIRAQAKIVRAQGDAEAIRLKGQALAVDPRLSTLEWVEQVNPDTVVLLPEKAMPILPMPGSQQPTQDPTDEEAGQKRK